MAALFSGDPVGLREAARINNLAAVHLATGSYAEAGHPGEGPRSKSSQGRQFPQYPRQRSPGDGRIPRRGPSTSARCRSGKRLSAANTPTSVNPSTTSPTSTWPWEHIPRRGPCTSALAIREKALGRDHPDVAESLNNLAIVHVEVERDRVPPELAKALVRTGGDIERTLALAREAAVGYRSGGEQKAEELADVEAFLEEYGDGARPGRSRQR